METPISKVSTSKKRKWLKRVTIALLIIIILPLSLFTIGWFNRDSVIDVLHDWYADNTSGTLTIGNVNARFLSGFPNVSFTLKDISYTNSDSITDQFTKIHIEDAKMTITAANLLRGNFTFNKIAIRNGEFFSEVISEKPHAYHEQLKLEPSTTNGFQIPKWLNPNGSQFSLTNITYIFKDTILNKCFDLHIHKLKGYYKANDLILNGKSNLDVSINHLGFNTTKGSFLKGARISGNPEFYVDLEKDLIAIPSFPLHLNDQIFQLSADFDLAESNGYLFKLQNQKTDFNVVKSLLSENIFSKMENFEIKKPFNSTVTIKGDFAYGNNPDVEASFSTSTNAIVISDQHQFKNVTFSGNFTNDIYKSDILKKEKKSNQDFKLFFKYLNAELEDITIASHDSYFQSTPDAINFIEANVLINGRNETMANLIGMENFDFEGGNFELNANISGDIPNPYQVLNKATGTFNLKNTRVILKKNGLQLPIQAIELSLEREDSYLKRFVINLPNGENLILKGELKNVSGLLSKTPLTPTTSRISINSNSLNINEVLAMAKEFAPITNSNDRKALHESLKAVYSQFHPQFDIAIGALKYNDVTITKLKSNVALIDAETVLLRDFKFNYNDAVTNLKGNVKIYPPESRLRDAFYMNAEATSEGSLDVFAELFNIQLFRIDSGRFKFNGKMNGNVKAFNELLNSAEGNLTLTNVDLYYPPIEMDIAMDSLALFINHSDIILEQFNLEIDEFHPIKLNGSIKDFPNFLLDEIEEPGSIYLKVTAPFVDGDALLAKINSIEEVDTIAQPKKLRAMRDIFKDINKFNPEIELAIDSLKFKNLITENIDAQIYFENDSILKLNYFDLNYKESTANLHGQINVHSNRKELLNDNPFDLNFSVQVKGKSQDLNDYLNTSNFLFKSGEFEFYGNYEGQSKNLKLLNSRTFGDLKIGGTLMDFEVADIQIPIDSLHLEINNNLATLKTLDIQLPGKSEAVFSGSIDHFSEFVNGTTALGNQRSTFSIHAPYLDTADIITFLEGNEPAINKTTTKEPNLQKWKEALTKINTSFYPSVTVQIDTLIHESLSISDFESQLLFDNKGLFKIEDTHFEFSGGSITMTVETGISKADDTPVAIEMSAKAINIHELLSRFDYFKNEDLKAAEATTGRVNYNITANGTLDNDGKLNMNSLNGVLNLDIQDLALYDYKLIMENIPLMKDERFKNLRFQPIVQTFEIINGEIIIPRTEIQSSGLHVFAEGRLKLNEYLNIWISVPWNNLKRNDGLLLPEKTNYKDAGSKFFIQLVQDKTSEKARKEKLKVKIRLGNRKLRKTNDSL